MKKTNKTILWSAAVILALTSCKDKDFENYKIQSVDNHGVDQNMISTAVTATSSTQFYANAVDASTELVEYNMIPVVLTAKDPASQDIHVTMVPALDTLASYNAANGTTYVMPGDPGSPAFTLEDGGVVTIPKGSSVGYLKIKTVSSDYFGATQYAFSYRIGSIQEPGYTISGNNNFGIVALIPKNMYDAKYALTIETDGWDAYGISDGLPGDYGTVALVTTGANSNIFGNLIAGGNGQPGFTTDNATKTSFGATGPVYVFDSNNKLIDVYNSVPDDGRGRAFSINPAALSTENLYDPTTKTFIANYLFHQNGRPDCTVKMTMTYVGPR